MGGTISFEARKTCPKLGVTPESDGKRRKIDFAKESSSENLPRQAKKREEKEEEKKTLTTSMLEMGYVVVIEENSTVSVY